MYTANEFPYIDFNKVNLDWISDELKADKQQIAQNTADIEELKAGGTVIDYEDLQNLPEINGVTLIGDKSLEDIGAASANELSELKSALNTGNIFNYANLDAQIFPGKNLSNPKRFVNGYRITGAGDVVSDSTASALSLSDYIFIKANTDYVLSIDNGTFLTIAKYDSLFNYVSSTTIGAPDIRGGKVINYTEDSYIRVFGIIAEMPILQIEQASAKTDFEKYSPRLNDDVTIDGVTKKTAYRLPFIYDQKCCCNRVTNSLTAYYTGVDLGEKVNRIYANFIFEDSSKVTGGVGTVALILNANGVKKISDITDLSIHCTITQTLLKVDIFGDRYGTRYYQNLINQSINLVADGETEHTVLMYAKLASGIVTVTLDGNDYNGQFTPTNDVLSLFDVVGNYATLEHFCNGDRNNIAMPMFTYFAVQNVAGYMLLKDYFDRQDGQLSTAPNGIPYSLMNNGDYAN